MTWKKGQSGNPRGHIETPEQGRFAAAMRRHANAHPDKLDKIAAATFDKALGGDQVATAFLRDTFDGRPIQRQDIMTTSAAKPLETLDDTQLAARIAQLEAEQDTKH